MKNDAVVRPFPIGWLDVQVNQNHFMITQQQGRIQDGVFGHCLQLHKHYNKCYTSTKV